MSSDLVAYSEIPAAIDSESRGPNMETVPRGRFSLLGPRGFVTPSAKRPNQRGEREEGDGYPNDDQT